MNFNNLGNINHISNIGSLGNIGNINNLSNQGNSGSNNLQGFFYYDPNGKIISNPSTNSNGTVLQSPFEINNLTITNKSKFSK